MTYYLLKTEPSVYSFADLQKDKKTVWDGVTSPAAVKHMREMEAPGAAHHLPYRERKTRALALLQQYPWIRQIQKIQILEIEARKTAQPNPRHWQKLNRTNFLRDHRCVREGRLSVVPLTKEQYEALAAR